MSKALFDPVALRDEFFADRRSVSLHAKWEIDDPGAPPNTCRFCGKPRQWWAITKLDGHAACIVSDAFKQRIGEVLRSSPTVTYKAMADALGVSTGVVQSWAYSAGIAGPVSHKLRKRDRS